MKSERSWRQWLISAAVFLAAVLVLSPWMKPKATVEYQFQQEGFTVKAPDGTSAEIRYDGMEEISLESGSAPPEEAVRILDDRVKSFLLIRTSTQIYAVNYESEESTRSLYEALVKMRDGT